MVEKKLKVIQDYGDLNNSLVGQSILIKGRVEVVIDPNREYLDLRYNEDRISKKHRICTLSLDGDNLVQNHYSNSLAADPTYLDPFAKVCCKIGSGTDLENELMKFAELGGLL